MKPLSATTIAELLRCQKNPVPTQEINPGLVHRLWIDGLISLDRLPSSGGRTVPHATITPAGVRALAAARAEALSL